MTSREAPQPLRDHLSPLPLLRDPWEARLDESPPRPTSPATAGEQVAGGGRHRIKYDKQLRLRERYGSDGGRPTWPAGTRYKEEQTHGDDCLPDTPTCRNRRGSVRWMDNGHSPNSGGASVAPAPVH